MVCDDLVFGCVKSTMHYYSYNIKMKDARGGFSGFLGNSSQASVDGIAHLLVREETMYSEQQIQQMLQMVAVEVVGVNESRPFSEQEYARLPQKFKDQLQRVGSCLQAIPNFSSSIQPFSES